MVCFHFFHAIADAGATGPVVTFRWLAGEGWFNAFHVPIRMAFGTPHRLGAM